MLLDLTELDRLAFMVNIIENDCHIIPQGAMRLTENHEVARNCSFRGLNEHEAFDLEKYSHFRNVQSKIKQ